MFAANTTFLLSPSQAYIVSRLGGLAIACAIGCSAGGDDLGLGGESGRANGNGHNGTGPGPDQANSTVTGSFSNGSTVDSTAAGQGGGCAGTSVTAQKTQLDLFIMLDQSGSMDAPVPGGTRWSVVTKAIEQFVQSPQASGLGVGIQYFGLPPAGNMCPLTCTSDAQCGGCGFCLGVFLGACLLPSCVCSGAISGDSCNASDYASAAVPIAPLPGNAAAIVSSMGMHGPLTGTPTMPALQGAIDFSKQWASMNPSHTVVTVLASDGFPEICDTNINNIAAVAAAGFNGAPSIRTFVIGVGTELANLNAIAQGGGTGMAFLVDTNANAGQQFVDALVAIQGSALACSYQIPEPPAGQTLDFGAVNVQYTPGGGAAQVFPKVANEAACQAGADGWYYDNEASPTQIILCKSSCDKVSADLMGKIDIVLGCATFIP